MKRAAYCIKQTRSFAGHDPLIRPLSDQMGDVYKFKTPKAAQELIDLLEASEYRPAPNETALPTYQIQQLK